MSHYWNELPLSANGQQPHVCTLPADRRKRDDFAVVTCVFNPRGFASRYRLYRQFAHYVNLAGVRLVTVEVALGDRPYVVTRPDNPDDIQLRTCWELWHKERALNIGIEHAVRTQPNLRYLAWIDADVTFVRHDWAAATCEQLQHHHVVQMFGEAADLGPDEQIRWKAPSTFAVFHRRGFWMEGRRPEPWNRTGHPGLAWAARRETLDKLGGLLDVCIAGSADTHMANALKGDRGRGDHKNQTLKGFSPAFLQAIQLWADRCEHVVKHNVGYVPGTVLHHWHGNGKQRGYTDRWAILKHHQFDPCRDLVRDCSGLWRFAIGREKLADDIRRSLAQRNEDSIDV
jgi:hypothetical protein